MPKISFGSVGAAPKKSIIIGSVIFLIGLALASVFYFKPNFFRWWQKDMFDGFSKLVLSNTNAQDNFILTAQAADSLGVEANSVYILNSKEDVPTKAIADNLKLQPELKYSLSEKGNKTWQIELAEPAAPNTLIKMALTANYTDEQGAEQIRNYEWAFQVKDTFKVLSSIPRDAGVAVPTNTGIEVTFSHDNFKDYEKYFSISPQIEGKFEKHGRTLVFVPSSLITNQIYTVTIKQGLPLTDSQEILGADYVFSFETQNSASGYDYNNPWLSISNKMSEVSTSEAPLIQLYSRNLRSNYLDVFVYPLAGEKEYMSALGERDKIPVWAYSRDNYLYPTENIKALSSFRAEIKSSRNTQYIDFPDKLPAGYYIVSLKNDNIVKQAFLQVTDLSAYISEDKQNTVAWVMDLASQKPASGARIELVGGQMSAQSTDSQGFAKFTTPAALDQNDITKPDYRTYYFRVTLANKVLIFPAGYIYRDSRYYSDSNADYWKYLYTDRPLYQTTDHMKFWGLLKTRDNVAVESELTLTLYKEGYVDYYYRPVVIKEQKVRTDNLGTFSGEFKFENLRPDYYTVELKDGDQVIVRKYIQIRPYEKPAYQISLIPEQKTEYAGTPIKMKGLVTFFEGTAVPNLSLVFDDGHTKRNLTTDENGEVNFDYNYDYKDCNLDYSCWPAYTWLSLHPELGENADIVANTSINFYGPKIYATSKVTYPASGQARVDIKTRKIDLAALRDNSLPYSDDRRGKEPAPNSKIEGEVTRITYLRTDAGMGYDFINKKSYKQYNYTEQVDKIDGFSGFSDQNGNYTYQLEVKPDTSYRVKIKYYDEQGRNDVISEYLYYYDGARLMQYNGSDYDYYRLQVTGEKFSVGENVKIDFVRNDGSLPDNGNNYYLYLQYQNGLQQYQIGQNSEYNFNFEQRDIPNVNVTGVYFNGKNFIPSGWGESIIPFDTQDKNLQINLKPDKSSYQPGEQVNLSVQTKNASGQVISAAVNLNLIDEAFYAVMDDQANPIESIYTSIGSGVIYRAYSHRTASDFMGGAEKGGCFLAGTKILMADGSSKNIEEIAVGDQISTWDNPLEKNKSLGMVTEIYQHVVSQYLVINGKLRVTPEHLVYTNMNFRPAERLQVGDWLLMSDGQVIYIQSIEKKFAIVPVYNFKVDPQHTYFADGIYVHNEKGGGPREFFTDAALFQSLNTDGSGQGSVSFKLPDNVTSWRVTAQGISLGMDVGVSVSKIPVSLPAFIDVNIGREYISGDEPVVRLRSYGAALHSGDKVNLSILSSDLGLSATQGKDTSAFASAYFPLPKLVAGKFNVTYALKSDQGNDAIKLPLTVVDSRLTVQQASSTDLSAGYTWDNTNGSALALTFSDKKRGAIFQVLQHLFWNFGSRLDQALARKMAPQIYQDIFGTNYFDEVSFVGSQYQMTSGGLTLLPYSSEDLELSARVSAVAGKYFDQQSLTQYFFHKLEDKSSNSEEITLALYGLATQEQPILPRLDAWLKRSDLSASERLYVALAYSALGEKEKARQIYLALLAEYGQVKEPHVVLKVGDNNDQILQNTALAGTLAAQLNDSHQYGFFDYLSYNRPKEILLNLEELSFIQAQQKYLPQSQAKIVYTVNGARQEQTFSPGNFSYSWELQPGQKMIVEESTPGLVLISNRTVPLVQTAIANDNSFSIRREYYVDGKATSVFKENDMIEVRLYPGFQKDALDGNYQITDILPSGLAPVTKLYSGQRSDDCHFWFPFDTDGQKVKYILNKNWRQSYCGNDYFKYYARVKTKGSYRAEPAIIQSMLNPDYLHVGQESKVQIN